MTTHDLAEQGSSTHRRRASDQIRTVTADTFKALVLDATGPVAVEFMSYGCGFCRALEPSLQQAAETLGTREPLFRINVGVESELAEAYAIQGTPTILLFLEGQEITRIEGPPPSPGALVNALTTPFESAGGEST